MVRKIAVALAVTFLMGQVVSATNYTASTPAQVLENVTKLVAGDSLILEAGTYTFSKTERVFLKQSGERGKRIFVGTKGTNRAKFDFSAHGYEPSNPDAYKAMQGILVHGNWWYIRGLDVFGAGDNGMLIEDSTVIATKKFDETFSHGSYNIVEWCTFYENNDSGLQLKNGAAFDTIINCDSYFNYDANTKTASKDGGDADGFAPKQNCGPAIYFYGCRAWHNCDDGWDAYFYKASDKPQYSQKIKIVCEYSIVLANGSTKTGKFPEGGNGNGFKMGSEFYAIDFETRHCLAVANKGNSKGKGFDANNNPGEMTMINCSGYLNGEYDYSMQSGTSFLTNCNNIGGASKIKINSTPTTSDWTGDTTDFESTDTNDLKAARNSDGSLPTVTLNFMKPKSGDTTFIDKGTNLDGRPTSGAKADIGWIEVGLALDPNGPLPDNSSGIKVSRNENSATKFITDYSMSNGVVNFNLTYLPSGKLDVAIFDVTGKKVMDLNKTFGAANKSQIIDMSKFSAGTYICNFTFTAFDGVRSDIVKLIKE